jgi:flagellar biosynthesis/type III secretory pathway chaperone
MERRDLESLVELLAREVDLLQRLSAVLREEQEVLVAGDVARIKAAVEAQIDLVRQFAAVEDQRRAVLARLNKDGRYGSESRMDRVIEDAGEKAPALRDLRESLREVLEGLGTVNKRNGMLIRQSLSYIDRTIRLIAGEDRAAKQYTPNGDLRSVVGNVAVDRKV